MDLTNCICFLILALHWRGFQGLKPGAPCFTPNLTTGCRASRVQQNGRNIRYAFENTQKGVAAVQKNTLFFLFTRRNPEYPEFLHDCRCGLSDKTNFNPIHRTEIFIHGHRDGTCRRAWMKEMKDRLLFRGPYNVILVDWTWGNSAERYQSVINTKYVGDDVASLILNIMKKTNASGKDFHLIGHSLGAHICGFIGQKVCGLRRITGLDPSYDPFHNRPPNRRLDVKDAILVDIIHTNGGNGSADTIGDFSPLGDADFYPNGGTAQPICLPHINQSQHLSCCNETQRNCSHFQSIEYYKASINPCGCKFVGVECEDYASFQSGECRSCGEDGINCAVMGMDWEHHLKKCGSRPSANMYYLKTTTLYPYCDNSGLSLEGFSTARWIRRI